MSDFASSTASCVAEHATHECRAASCRAPGGRKLLRDHRSQSVEEINEERLWTVLHSVDPNLNVDMWTAGMTGVAGEHDRLAGGDLIAEGDGES